jgi:hypothetical protein
MSERQSDSLLAVVLFLGLWFFSQALVDYLDRCAPNTPVCVATAQPNNQE